MPARTPIVPRLALLFALAGALPIVPAQAAADDSTAPSLPKHEMGGNDAKPGFFDHGSANSGPSGEAAQKVPGPGKAAGSSYPDAPPVPMAK